MRWVLMDRFMSQMMEKPGLKGFLEPVSGYSFSDNERLIAGLKLKLKGKILCKPLKKSG